MYRPAFRLSNVDGTVHLYPRKLNLMLYCSNGLLVAELVCTRDDSLEYAGGDKL